MRLEMAEFPVRQIRFAGGTRYHDGLLEVERDDLTRLVLGDARIHDAGFEIVAPGELVRVTGIRDAVEQFVGIDRRRQRLADRQTVVAHARMALLRVGQTSLDQRNAGKFPPR